MVISSWGAWKHAYGIIFMCQALKHKENSSQNKQNDSIANHAEKTADKFSFDELSEK